MHASWVEMISTRKGTEFQATPLGVSGRRATTSRRFHKSSAGLDSTSIRSPAPSFARELRIVHQRDLASDVIRLPQADLRAMGDVFAALENDDEVIVGVRASLDKLLRRFTVVSVKDAKKVEGLPSRGASSPVRLHLRGLETTGGARQPSPRLDRRKRRPADGRRLQTDGSDRRRRSTS
jgi:hypothetical protein